MTLNALEQYSLHHANKNLKFYLTGSQPCPYIENKIEKKVFTTLDGDDKGLLNEALTHAGFRRSQNIAYRPSCDMCNKCVSVRVDVKEFEFSHKWRRILNKGQFISKHIFDPIATDERYCLLKDYLNDRHFMGGMSDMSPIDFIAMIEEKAPHSKIYDYRLKQCNKSGEKGKLIACVLVDELSDGNSLIYSFYDPNLRNYSLGTYIILDQIVQMKAQEKPFLYLGYWIEGSKKMEYKARFKPLEFLGNGGWERQV